MERLLIVSNRLPVSVVKRGGGIHYQSSAGGLATALSSMSRFEQKLWIGWSGLHEKVKGKERDEIAKKLAALRCIPVFLSQYDIESYYYGFCNRVIWPLFHYFPGSCVFNRRFWEAYKRVNHAFLDEVLGVIKDGDVLWIHDYHLMLLPQLVRRKKPEAKIGFFLHIPFPNFEIFRIMPWRREILEGLMGADLLGFHVISYVENFLGAVRRILGFEHRLGIVAVGHRLVKADAFPIGIDFDKFHDAAVSEDVQQEIGKIRKRVGDRKIILCIDRLDYTKGILKRLEAFDHFLDRNPGLRGKLTLIVVAIPSRTGVEQYAMLKKRLDELVGHVNGKHGTLGWVPIWYLYRSVPFPMLSALYNVSDVGFVMPHRDGMNLVAKEFIASKRDGRGALILSEMAGAAAELGEAIIVNPNNMEEVAAALKQALEMNPEDQIALNRTMQARLKKYDINRWSQDFLDRLQAVLEQRAVLSIRFLTEGVQGRITKDYSDSSQRLLLLDYDGTLVDFAEKPEKAVPDRDLLQILKNLSDNPKNEVVIVSGRERQTLDRWFGSLRMGIIAEHGVWIKEAGADWKTLVPLGNADWKAEIKPILENFSDRTPGSFVEEKEFSLVWHYRKVDPDLASMRANELKNSIIELTSNLNLGVMDGNKVVEIKNTGVNKGQAALEWIQKGRDWTFTLAAGDDVTDEDLFSVVPPSGYSIKVGLTPSRASFNLESVADMRRLLAALV